MSVIVIGLNHHTAPIDVLERTTIADADRVKATHDIASRDGIDEAVVLSTCNRTEVYVSADKFHAAYDTVRTFLCERSGLLPEQFSDHLFAHYDLDAVLHLFEVTCGVHSAVLGETEILGQVKSAWELARTESHTGAVLNPTFKHAIEVGKRARTETSISRHTTSVSQAAVAMAIQRLGTLDGRTVLLLGAGDMGEGMAVSLRSAGVGDIRVANRTWENGVALAERIAATPVRLGELDAALLETDVLLTSTGASSMIVEGSTLDAVMARRSARPLLIVDIAMPRDVDPAAADIDGVTLLDMDDLRTFTEAGVAERRREITAVNTIVTRELDRYVDQRTTRKVDPLISELFQHVETIRAGEIARFSARLERLDPDARELVEAITRGLIGKLLFDPVTQVKESAGTAQGERLAQSLRQLFDLS